MSNVCGLQQTHEKAVGLRSTRHSGTLGGQKGEPLMFMRLAEGGGGGGDQAPNFRALCDG